MPEVSVILPNYNHARFLKHRIESIIHQTFQDFELIILDDCSTDDSRNVIEAYRSHPRIAGIVYNEQNSGSPFLQWEKGIAHASGQYIWIAESDDYCQPAFLETCINGFNRYNDATLVYTNSCIVDDQDNVVYENLNWWLKDIDAGKWQKDYYNRGTKEIGEALSVKNTIPNASAVVFKKQFYKEAVNFKYAGDWLFWIRVLENGNLVFIKEPLNCFRSHSLTTRNYGSIEKKRSFLKEKIKIIQYLKKKELLPADTWNMHKNNIVQEWISLFKPAGVFGGQFFIPFNNPALLLEFFAHKVSDKLKRK